MSLSSTYRSLDAVAQHLPFHLNETDRANEAFSRWRNEGAPEAKRIVDVWTYCFIRRYFLAKLARDASHHPGDFDALVEETYRKVDQHQGTVQQADRYASWVSVVCKNTFLNYLRARRRILYLEEGTVPSLMNTADEAVHDLGLARQAVHDAIGRLPPFLQETARLRFVEDRSYPDIAAAIGKSVATARAYVNKVLNKLRADDQFMAYFRDLDADEAGI